MSEIYTVYFADSVLAFIEKEVSFERVLERIKTYHELLSHCPRYGAVHDPAYAAARPPFPCRYAPIPDTPFTLYYAVDDDKRHVAVFYIEYGRATLPTGSPTYTINRYREPGSQRGPCAPFSSSARNSRQNAW